MKRIVCDAGPLIHLYEAGLMRLFDYLEEVLMPVAVKNEVYEHIHDYKMRNNFKVKSLNTKQIREAENLARFTKLHSGEIEAIVLARDIKARWLLTDDYEARVYAGLLNLEVHGSLGFVAWCIANKRLSQEEGLIAIDRLKQSSLWLSEKIYDRIKSEIINL